MSDSDQDQDGMRREGRLGGVRLVGIFVPWQAVALTLAVVVGMTALAVGRWTGGETQVHLTSADGSTTTTTAAVTSTPEASTTTTAGPAPSTTTAAPVVPAAPRPTTTTSTTAPAPSTCAVIRSAVTGTVSSSWSPSPATPGSWDRHVTVTVANPIDQPVILGYVGTSSSVTSYLVQLAGADGRRLGVGESVTVEDTFTFAGDHTVRGYSPPPDKLSSVEFTPVSAPGLFCQASVDRPGETSGAKPHPTQPSIYVTSQEDAVSDFVRVTFRANGLFAGLRVHYRMLMRDGLQERTLDLPPDFQGVSSSGLATYPLAQLKDYGKVDSVGQAPWFEGVTRIEWNGTSQPCTAALSNICAPADGSLLPPR
jgi:hypothetical protein